MKQWFKSALVVVFCLSLLVGSHGAVLRASAAGNSPILLILSSAAPNKLGPFVSEILRAEGISSFDQVDLSNLTAAQLAQYDLAILVQAPLTGVQASMLTSYVSGGGNLLAMRPDPQIAPIFGLPASTGTLTNGYLQILNNATFAGSAPGAGLTSSTLQIHGDADLYGSVGGVMLAQLYSDATTSTAYPAVVAATYGSGQAGAFTYDLPSNIAYTRQGNPANANIDVDGDYYVRTIDLFQTIGGGLPWVDRNKIPIPQADEQQRLFARLVQQFVGRTRPLPQLWYFPDTAKTMLIYTSDAHWNSSTDYSMLMSDMNAHQAPMTVYLTAWTVVGGNSWDWPSNANLQTWQGQGDTFGLHPWVLDGSTLASGMTTVSNWFSSNYTVPRSTTIRVHRIQWSGWTDSADVEASYGLGMDFSFYHYGKWLQKPDGTWPHGYITGSGLPMKFVRSDGTLTSVFQQLTEMADDQLFTVNGGFEGVTGAQALALSQGLIDASLAGNYSALTDIHHVDSYSSSSDLRAWATGVADYAHSKGVPIWNGDRWLSFTQTRHDANFSGIAWDASTGSLTFNMSAAATAGANLTTMLPLSYAGKSLTGITVDGAAAPWTVQTVKGVNVAFVSVPAGNHSFSATYQAGVPTATPGATAAATPTPTATPTAGPATSTPTPTPTSTPSNSVTQDTYLDFGQSCAVVSGSHVSDSGGGAVQLAATFADDFAGSALDTTKWVAGTWSGGSYSPTLGNSVLTIQNSSASYVRSQSTFTHGTMEAIGQFGGGPYQHIGFGSLDFSGNQYLLFSTYTGDGNLWARANTGGGEQRVNLGALPTGMHRYRIEWTALNSTTDSVTFYLDGVQVASMQVSNTGASNFYLYLSNSATTALSVDAAQVTPTYTSSGTYTSCALNAGAGNAWQNVNWDSTVPGGTSLAVQVRTSPDSTTWTAWSTVASSGAAIPSPDQYVQYQLLLSSTDSLLTPQLNAITMLDGTGVVPTPTPTAPPAPTYTPTPTATATATATATPTNTPTATPTPTLPPACPCSIWSTTATPANPAASDGQPIEIGVKFRSDVGGYITGLRFYKGSANTGTHTGHLWSATGTQLASATFTNETASGWQEVTLATPVAIAANTTFVASYYSTSGFFAIDPSYFASAGVDNPPLHALQSGVDGPNGVYVYGASVFPANGSSYNYWVDVVFNTSAPATPTPTAAPTDTPTPAPTFTPTPAPIDTPTATPTNPPAPTFTPTTAPTDTPMPLFTLAPTSTPTATATATPTATPLPTATNTPTPTASPTAIVRLLGTTSIGGLTDNEAAGRAEAFIITASASGTLQNLSVYLDSSSTASQVVVGLYSNTTGSGSLPATLLAQGTISAPRAGAWNAVTVPPTTVTAGTTYWIAVLQPSGALGKIRFRDLVSGSKCVLSSQTTLTRLPATWSSGKTYSNSPLSAYGF